MLDENQDQLLGGGSCCSSRIQINELNLSITHKNDEAQIKNNSINEKFELKYKNLINKDRIIQSIHENNQLKLQSSLLQECIIDQLNQDEEQVYAYKLEIQDIFENYIMLETTIISQKSDQKQETFEKILLEVESIQVCNQDVPIMELMFYTQILINLNKINYKFDENEQKEVKEFMNRILNFSNNKGIFSDLVSNIDAIRKYVNLLYKKKDLYVLKYSIEIWLKKIDEFGEKFIQMSENVSSEILFYVKIFFEIHKLENQSEEIILTLIRINCLLEKFQKDTYKKDMNIYQSFCNNLMNVKIDEFLSELMQKSEIFIKKLFLIFSVENQNYRYTTLSILINFYSIFTFTTQNTSNQEYLLVFLSNKYLIEKQLEIRVLFEKNHDFVQNFEKNIKNKIFQEKIINFDKQRKFQLRPYIKNIDDFERSINTFDDIIKLISDNDIERWERDIKKRQRQNLAQKDDVLLEVKDLYINQMITYQRGNPIFQKNQKINNIESHTLDQNALQDILQLFLNPNYSYRLKQFNNKSGENQNEQIFQGLSKQCEILGILAEGGTGKSMLMKKIETFLIEKLSKLNTETETGNYLPLLIKCNSLDSKNPSLDDYLKKYGGIKEDQIQSLKQNERNKLILLDGYDEYTGDYFVIYKKLNLNLWRNTKVIVATRKEKLSEEDASIYFSKENEKGVRDEMSYSLVKLEEFTKKDIHEYAERYFKQERKTDQIEKDLKNLEDCLKNKELEKLLHLPINLYLFTRMLVHLSQKEILNFKTEVSDQTGIQEIFFNDQFVREAQSFIDAHVNSEELKKDQEFRKSLKNSYFEYFQTLAMRMFLNRDVKSNYLQVEKENIKFNIQQQVIHVLLNKELINTLLEKIKNYINTKIVTLAKEEVVIDQESKEYQNKQYLIQFRHKSLFEYFAARAMKYDFDVHRDNIHNMSIEQLKDFNINKKSIMNAGENKSEQQILIKFFKMIQSQINSDEFYQSYHLEQIEKNSRYIQYIKKSTIKKNTETSQIDVGASNMLSALFLSRFSYSKLQFRYCSFSKLYVSCQKSDLIIFDQCNLSNSFLKNLVIDYDSCNTQFAAFDVYQKVFDSSNIFSINKVIWDKRKTLYSIAKSGFINAFQIENQNKIVLYRSKQLSQTPLSQILAINDQTLLVSSQYSLLLINSVSFELLHSYKFKNQIVSIAMIKDNILVILENDKIFHGSFTTGFRKMNIIGSGCIYNEKKQILLIYSGGNFSLYNTEENFKVINTIQGHSETICSAAFSADGKYLATGSADNTCKIWNAEKNFELINTIQGHTSHINSVAFSADGKYLATGSSDETCQIWNGEKCFELINTIQGHTDGIISVAFSADGKYLTTGSLDNTCRIWNAEKIFELINTIQGHTSFINSVAFSANGKYLATGSGDQTCQIWNAEKGFELINTIQGHTDGIMSVAFSADGKYLATGSKDNSCNIWNAEKGFDLIKTIQGHTFFIGSVAFSANGKYLATGSNDKTCKIWNAEKGFELINTIQGHTKGEISVAFSGDGKYLAIGQDKNFKILNAEKGFELINTIQSHTENIFSVAFSADGKYLATCSGDTTCKIWNAEKGFELINTIQGHTDWIFSVDFSADGKYLSTGSKDNTCKIWNVEKGFELINTIQGHTNRISSVAFSADRKYLATGSWDETCKIWNAEKGFEFINTIQGHTEGIISIAYSSDGKYLATSSRDNTCKIWNAENGFELITAIQCHFENITSVGFSVDGKYICIEQNDRSYNIYELQNFKLIENQNKYQLIQEKYQLEQSQNDEFERMKVFENMFIL